MKKRNLLIAALPLVALTGSLVSCSGGNSAEIALVTDVGNLKDGSFNEGTWNGVEKYAKAHNKTYQYYQPTKGEESDRITAYTNAIDNGAKIIVTPGFLQAGALRNVAPKHPDVKFIFVDGWNVTDKVDDKGNDNGTVIKNVHGLTYKEQESGYMAGYAAVKEGYKKFGGTFGGAGTNPACNRFAYGYAQGINDAAAGVEGVELKVSYKYSSSFQPSTELQTQMNSWYQGGTEVIFACGGGMVDSVKAASDENVKAGRTAKIIGVDVDQKGISDQVITSATKGLEASVEKVLGQIYDNKWDSELAGKSQALGAKDDSTGIAYHSDRLTKFTKANYDELLGKVKDGSISIKDDVAGNCDETAFWIDKVNAALTNVTITLDK